MAFILDRLKQKISGKDEDKEESPDEFNDLNYIIGNSSAMDVGEVPQPLDQRIGYAAQIGGSLIELQITNPATFSLEGDAMIDVINQLGLDVTTHPDMNAGFCTAEMSARGEEYGYETIEQYFTDYLQELAAFKKQVERLGKGDKPLFNIGRMNPHISTSPMPSLDERMANDIGVDPFGYQVDEYGEHMRKMRQYNSQDIWANKEFLKKFYSTFLVNVVDQKWQLFEGRRGLFTQYSGKFDRIYRDTKRKACDSLYEEEVGDSLQKAISLISTAARADVGVQNAWLNKIDDEKEEKVKTLEIDANNIQPQFREKINEIIGGDIEETFKPVVEDFQVSKLSDINSYLPPNVRVTRINSLPEADYRIRNKEFSIPRKISQEIKMKAREKIAEEDPEKASLADDLAESILQAVEVTNTDDLKEWSRKNIRKGLDEIWKGETNEGGEDEFLITVRGKMQALSANADIDENKIRNEAMDIEGFGPEGDPYGLDDAAKKALANEDGFFEKEDRYHEFMSTLLGQFEREIWKESNLFYYIIPAWISSAHKKEYENHKGWESPKFIWDTIVKQKWGEREDVNLELDKPRNGIYDEDRDNKFHYLDLLENNREFRMDVAAAVGCTYAWGHFTQKKSKFDLKERNFELGEDEAAEVQDEGWTWVDWMNRFGLGVNLETMQASPQMRLKVWRPKDIAVAAHAINMTARKKLEEEGELGGLDHMNEELDGCPAKFTIDMEHVATMGVPPMHEMEIFFDQEEQLAENPELNIDEDKPVAKILRQMHLMDPGVDGRGGTYHGSYERGNKLLYEWLYTFVKHGFARNENERATILFELGEHKDESSYMMRLSMDLIQLGITPEELDPSKVDPSTDPGSEEEALIARFFGMDRANYTREWAKIEENAFAPLNDLLEAEAFENTYSGGKAVEDRNLQEWSKEEYR
jgi:hypothetical protein